MSAASFGRSRKVRTPQGRMPDNIRNGEPFGEAVGQGHRKKHLTPTLSERRGRRRGKVKRWCKRPPAFAVMQAAR